MNRNRNRHDLSGFTLIEVVIAMVIVGIISAMAYSSYTGHLRAARRQDAVYALTDLANRMERYYADTNTYATATIAAGIPATDVLNSANSPDGHYTLSIVGATTTATTFQIQATPQATSPQIWDTQCNALTLTDNALRGITGTGMADACW